MGAAGVRGPLSSLPPTCRQHPEVPEPRGCAPTTSREAGDKTQEVRGPSTGEGTGLEEGRGIKGTRAGKGKEPGGGKGDRGGGVLRRHSHGRGRLDWLDV